MAPPTAGKRVKGVQIYRPFIYGTTAKPFNDTDHPRPAGVPLDHTHAWTVFVKGVEDTDIFYWLRRVQFKLHESIPNHLRTLDADQMMARVPTSSTTTTTPLTAAAFNNNNGSNNNGSNNNNKKNQNIRYNPAANGFYVEETGWGEFEIMIKLYYDHRSAEKPQTLYHHLRLHPYGRTEAEKTQMRLASNEVMAWTYEEQLFNDPYEEFYKVLTTGAHDKGTGSSSGGKGKGKGKGAGIPPQVPQGDVKERTAMIPTITRPGHPFSSEAEALEVKRIKEAEEKVQAMIAEMAKAVKEREQELAALKQANAAA